MRLWGSQGRFEQELRHVAELSAVVQHWSVTWDQLCISWTPVSTCEAGGVIPTLEGWCQGSRGTLASPASVPAHRRFF